MKNKKESQKKHFLYRMIEREGIVLNKEEYDYLLRKINCGGSINLDDQSIRVKIKGIKIHDRWIVVVYDKMRKVIVTVLPKTSFYYNDLEKRINI